MTSSNGGEGRVLRIVAAICVVLAGIDVVNLALHFIHHHGYFAAEELPNFYGFFGLAACVVLILAARWAEGPLTRNEDWYDDAVD